MSHRHDKDRVVLALLALVRARHSVSRAELMDQFGPGTDHNLKKKQVFYVLNRMKRDGFVSRDLKTKEWIVDSE